MALDFGPVLLGIGLLEVLQIEHLLDQGPINLDLPLNTAVFTAVNDNYTIRKQNTIAMIMSDKIMHRRETPGQIDIA